MGITGSPARSLPCCGPNRGCVPRERDTWRWVAPPHPSNASSSRALVPPLLPSPHRPGVGTAPRCCLSLSAPLSSVGPHPTPICVTSPFTQPCGGDFCFLLGPWLLRYLNEDQENVPKLKGEWMPGSPKLQIPTAPAILPPSPNHHTKGKQETVPSWFLIVHYSSLLFCYGLYMI